MGKNYKRKATLIVLIVIAVALVLFPLVPQVFTALTTVEAAAISKEVTTYLSIDGERNYQEYSISYNEPGTYMIIAAGQNGEYYSSRYYDENYCNGRGAVCLGFYQTTSPTGSGEIAYIGTNENFTNIGETYYPAGGGSTQVPVNFALPTINTVNGTSMMVAAGGGGGAELHQERLDLFYKTNSSYPDAPKKFGNSQYSDARYVGVSDDMPNTGYYGLPGCVTVDGYSGSVNGSSVSRSEYGFSEIHSNFFKYGVARYSNGNFAYYTSCKCSEYYLSGNGGAGVTNGGGGGSDPDKYYVYSGGGGTCSKNCYPIYTQDSVLGPDDYSENGYLKIYRIDPASTPAANVGSEISPAQITEPGVGSDRYTPAGVNSDLSGYIKTGWVYSTDGKNWKDLAEINAELKNMAPGNSKDVTCKYVIYAVSGTTNKVGPSYNMKHSTAASAATDPNYTIKTETINVSRKKTATFTAPTAKTVVFNNQQQELINAGSVTGGTMKYQLLIDGEVIVDWTEDAKKIKATSGSGFSVSYYIVGDSGYSDIGSQSSPLGSFSVTIDKADPQLNRGTLKPKANVIYNGEYQQVFEGRVAVGNSVLDGLSQGNIGYAFTTTKGFTDTPKPPNTTNVGGSTQIETEQTVRDAFYEDGLPRIIYMWYRMDEGPYNKEVPWTLLTDNNGEPITNQIQPVTLEIKATIFDEYYNGRAGGHQLIKDVRLISNSPKLVDNFEVTYIQKNTYVNNALTSEKESNDYTKLTDNTAACMDFYATWKVRSEVLYPYNYVIQEERYKYHLGTGCINQISDTDSIEVSGVPKNNQIHSTGMVKINGGKAKPFANQNIAVDITVCGTEADNMITSQESYGATPELKNINRLAFALSQSKDSNAVQEGDWKVSTSAEDLNDQIKKAVVDKSGWWYLHFKVLQHFNLETGTTFIGTPFYVYPGDLTASDLTGIVMAGNITGPNEGEITFDGSGHRIYASGELKTVDDSVGITFDGVKYALSTSSNSNAAALKWKENLDDLATVSDVGTYYLWVKWETNEQISAISGMVYGSFDIKPFDAANSNGITFSGGVFDDWLYTEEGNSINYIETYNNAYKSFGEMIEPSVEIINNDKIRPYHFGKLTFNYGTADGPIDNNFVTAEDFSSLKVKDVGIYHIWVKWDGRLNSNGKYNIEGGQAVYRTKGLYNIIRHSFAINKLEGDKGAEKVTLYDQDFVSAISNGEVKYKYHFVPLDGSCATVGEVQALFTSTIYRPVVIIDGVLEAYEYPAGSIQYLLSKREIGVTDEDVGWSNDVSGTMATDVGKYYLWVKIAINDNNLDIVKTIRLDKTARIVAVESPVCDCSNCEPTPALDENGNFFEADGTPHVLINPGNQINPVLEYSLDGETWYADYREITRTDAGTYYVYYRGADYKDGAGNYIFRAVDKDPTEYKCKQVIIESPGVKFKPYPESLNVKYNGQSQLIFSESKAFYANIEMVVVYSWDNENYYTYDKFRDVEELKQTKVGRYTLWVDVLDQDIPGYDGCEPRSVTVEILKADIQVSPLVFYGGDFVYKGADYQLLPSDVDYGMIDSGKNFIKVNDVSLSYSNRNNYDWLVGDMGKIWYIATMSKEEVPGENDDWKESYAEVTARNAGDYYIWVKVEAGQYHNGLAATCWNPINPIVINPLDNSDNNQYIVADRSIYAAITGLSYTGVEQKLINALDLKVSVIDRNNQGEVELNEGEVTYNLIENLEELGSIYFTLIKQGDHIPDELSDDWVLGWESIGQVNAGTYHLCVMINSDNFAEAVQFNLSVIIDNADEIKIKPAAKNALQVSGITSVENFYTAAGQVLATGNLIVKIGEQDITNTDITETRFAYGAVNTKDYSSLNWSENLNEATATEVGDYQLYVQLYKVTGNISKSENESLIFPVFSETGLARIVRTSTVKVIYPMFAENLVFNNSYQSLITTHASLQMADGKTISGEIGAQTYYISSSPNLINSVNTTKEGKPLQLDEVQELHAGIYYIFVKFAQGTSHNEIPQKYLGSVTIAKASDKNIALSGIEFISDITYNGTYKKLISTSTLVKQTLIDDKGNTLKEELTVGDNDYSEIKYACSTDPNNQPVTGWVEDIDTLTARDAEQYYIWVKVTGGRNIATYTKCYSADEYVEIRPASLKRTDIGGVILPDNLVYTAESQSLASIDNGGVTISLESNLVNLNTPAYNNNLVISWGLSEAENIEPVDWEFDIGKLKGTNAGDYHLWIRINGSNNFYNLEKEHLGFVTIGKGSIAFINDPVIVDDLIYNGKGQELISSGPVAKFVAGGSYFNDHKNELVVEYSLDQQIWTRDYKEIKGIDAGEYEIYYRVTEGSDWLAKISSIIVSIDSVDASTQGIGLVEAPKVIEDIRYNEKAQDLISFGTLSTLVEGERGAAWEGVRIVFWYADAEDQKYEYYFNGEEYVWKDGAKLPGKTDVGTYTIRYYITESSKGNFHKSETFDLQVSIGKRQVWWHIAPQPVNNFRHTGEYQYIVTPGQLNVGITDPTSSAEGVKIMYSTKNPAEAIAKDWTETIPKVNTLGLFTVWYYVEVNGNNEFNGEETSPENAISITTLVERNMLTIVDAPRPEKLNYNACPQSLVNYYYLSTDVTDAYGEKAPFIEYSSNLDAEEWTSEITATDVDTYKIYYRLNYDPDLFVYEGNDGHDKNNPLSITAEITPARFTTDSIQAECRADENGKHYVTYKVRTINKYNNETGEMEEVPLYPQALMDEIDDYIVYYYRKNDLYHQEQNWVIWRNGETQFTDMAKYEFKLEIIAPENQNVNFVSYEQEGTVATYLNYIYARDIKLNIIMKDFNTPAYVRYWIDFDGYMKYEDETYFKKEGLVGRNGTLGDTFQYVNSNGYKNGGQIKLETTNQNTYYYVSDRLLTENERRKMKLDTQDLNSANKGFNIGLLNETTTIYLYEVYHIQYDNNYGIGDSLTDGWKWHNLDYRLEENKYKKFINGDYLEPNGWNTSRSGNGNSYNGASMTYRENSSQIFYAKFFGQNEKFYTISWVIDDGVNRYTLSRDFRVWFDALNPSYENRTTGTLVLEGDLITLPQVEVDEFGESLAEIFGGYVLGWHTADDETPYTIGMTAVRDMTFIAELNSELDDYVQAKFINADEQTVHESGKFASGAEAYMALSGMDANLMKDYEEGFNQWVDKYGYDYLDRANATDGLFTYQLGTKTVLNTDTANQDLTWADYMPMFIILAVGIIPLVACLIGYLIIRNKQHKKINQAN